MLEISSLHFDYQDHPLLRDIHFSLESGQFMHIQGANGAGKTTLLKLIAGLFLPHQGMIRWQGVNIQDDLAAFQNTLSFVGHKSGVHPALTVREHCRFDVNYRPEETDLCLALSAFGLLELSDQLCSTLSAGQLRRLGLVRLLMRKTALWILDESFSSLDQQGTILLSHQITQHVQRGGLVVATTHHALPPLDIAILEYYLS